MPFNLGVLIMMTSAIGGTCDGGVLDREFRKLAAAVWHEAKYCSNRCRSSRCRRAGRA